MSENNDTPTADGLSIPNSVDDQSNSDDSDANLKGSTIEERYSAGDLPEAAQNGVYGRNAGENYPNTHPVSRLDEIQKQADLAQRFLMDNNLVTLDELVTLIEKGLSGGQAIDFMAIERFEYGTSEWAEVRDVERQTIHKNIGRAERKLTQSEE